jgi:hypothetical protein
VTLETALFFTLKRVTGFNGSVNEKNDDGQARKSRRPGPDDDEAFSD